MPLMEIFELTISKREFRMIYCLERSYEKDRSEHASSETQICYRYRIKIFKMKIKTTFNNQVMKIIVPILTHKCDKTQLIAIHTPYLTYQLKFLTFFMT